jgi:hypothetical protein
VNVKLVPEPIGKAPSLSTGCALTSVIAQELSHGPGLSDQNDYQDLPKG